MSSPASVSNRASPSTGATSAAAQSLERAKRGSSTSLSSLPNRKTQPPALKPPSAEVQLDLSSASPREHPALLTGAKGKSKTLSPAATTAKSSTRTSIIDSSEVWRSSAAKRVEKAWAIQSEKALYSDAKFKKYTSVVERTLATFDSVSEWADFISFLGRLLKVTQSYPNFNVIPRKLIVAKRLAQCLNPALPSGVHQRALDVYSHILVVIGTDGLRRDLQIWTSGLLPFFQFASTSVKPSLLDIYEKHYVPLQEDLRPITRALQLALLPGLEEETGEFFDRTLRLLDSVSRSVGQAFFLQCLWLVLITTPSSRLAALNYLAKRMPTLADEVEPSRTIGRDVGLMVRGVSHALEDETLLVRRNALELLVTHLRMDKPLFQRHVKLNDKIILVRAAISVVLRRDLSLNRRLYSWLLGPEETVEAQTAYLRAHGLDLVRRALKEDFDPSSAAEPSLERAERQRPYKIFVSLLDKWEIGQPLTEVLVLDAFRALSGQMTDRDDDEMNTTANVFFEVVDPYLLYGQFAGAIRDQFEQIADGPAKVQPAADELAISPIELLCFVLKHFSVHDEETKQIHLPTLFAFILSLVDEQLSQAQQSREMKCDVLLDTLELLKLLLDLIPARVFGRRPLQHQSGETKSPQSIDFAARTTSFYAAGETDAEEAAQRFKGFEDISSSSALLRLCADVAARFIEISSSPSASQPHQELSVRTLDIFADLLRLLEEPAMQNGDANTEALDWDVSAWASSLLTRLRSASSFAEAERMVEVIVSCAMVKSARTSIELGSGDYIDEIVGKLLYYLEPERSPYHLRSTELLWAAQKHAAPGNVRRVLCQKLSDRDDRNRNRAMHAFGNLWRLSEDLPCEELWSPLLLVLDKLRSADIEEKQVAEAWLRVNLRSYPKMIDPLFHYLLACSPVRKQRQLDLKGLETEVMDYERPFEQQQSLYALQTLAALSRFSGQGFARALKSSQVSKDVESLLAATGHEEPGSYLDVLLDHSLTLLRSYPSAALKASMQKANNAVHAAAIELVQSIVQRGNLSQSRLRDIERAEIECLLVATANGAIEGQNRLLHALHSTLTARSAGATAAVSSPGTERVFSTASTTIDVKDDVPVASEPANLARGKLGLTADPLFLPMVQRGLSAASNRGILQHWSDFVLMAIPFFRSSVNSILLPINATVCEMIRASSAHVYSAYAPGASRSTFGAELAVQASDASCPSTEIDLTLLISLSERILLQALGEDLPQHIASTQPSANHSELREKAPPGIQEGSSGLLGYLPNVFSNDQSDSAGPRSGTAAAGRSHALQDTVQTLHAVWTMTYLTISQRDAKVLALESLVSKVRLRSRRALERIYRAQSADVVESLLECWQCARNVDAADDAPQVKAVFEILEFVAASAQIVVTYLCDVLSNRISGGGERARKMSSSFNASDASLFAFLEAYMARMPAQEASQVWPVMILLVKDFAGSSTSRKLHIFLVLRVFTVLGEKLCQTSAIDDRRTRRDLQENYVKLVDSAILVAGRSYDQSTWIRRSGKNVDDEPDMDGSGVLEKDEKAAIPGVGTPGVSLIDAIIDFLASRALPALRKFQIDSDKVNAIASNAVYYIVAPNFRTKAKTLEVNHNVLSLVGEMVRLPGTLKAWRTAVGDVFQDNRFFTMTPALAERWKPVVLALMVNDKERLIELLGKITSAASANIFTNRELEMLTRAFNLRRLSFVICSGERDAFLVQLPSIQERVVDLLRSNVSELVHAEVYLCMRVLLCRFSARHLSSFWPVIITELMRLFEGLIDELPPDDSDQLQLILSACKFLDLLLVLQTEDFQVHQWMFVTDTVDVVYAPDDWMAESIMDRLSTVVSERRTSGAATPPQELPDATHDPFTFDASPVRARRMRRRPLLTSRRNIQRIDQLLPFFQRVSLDSYEAMYEVGVRAPPAPALAGTGSAMAAPAAADDVDWPAVEAGLVRDMFEGESAP